MALAMQLCLYQPEIVYGDPAANLQRFEDCLASRASLLTDALVVLPELFTTGYVFEHRAQLFPLAESVPDGPTCQRLGALAQRYGCTLVAGLAEKVSDSLFNGVVAFGPQGFLGRYRKFAQTNIDRLYFERGGDRRGEPASAVGEVGNLLIFDWTVGDRTLRCGVAICFDLWFPQIGQSYAREEVDLLLHPSNFGGPQTLMVARGQAIEAGLAIATCNRVGQESARGLKANYRGESQVVNAQGEILAQAGSEAEFLMVDLDFPSYAERSRRILGVDWWDENQAIVERLNS